MCINCRRIDMPLNQFWNSFGRGEKQHLFVSEKVIEKKILFKFFTMKRNFVS